jgi:hypothetical protein
MVYLGWPKAIALWMMGIIFVSLALYLVCNFVEDGGSRVCEKCKLCR